MPLMRLLYFSTTRSGSANDAEQLRTLTDILAVATRRNRAAGVTGALAFDRINFIQVLEGEREHVWEIFRSILADRRHVDVVLVEFRETPARLFGEWSMGLATQPPGADPLLAPYRDAAGQLRLSEMNAETILNIVTRMTVSSYENLGSRI